MSAEIGRRAVLFTALLLPGAAVAAEAGKFPPAKRYCVACHPAAGAEAVKEYTSMALPPLALAGLAFRRRRRGPKPRTRSSTQ